MSEKFGKGIKAALDAKRLDPVAAPAAVSDEVDLEGYDYRVILHGGLVIQAISKFSAAELAVEWQKARKNDAVVAWNGDQFTEARQIAHIESVVEDEDADGEEDEVSTEALPGEASPAAPATEGAAS